MYKFQRCIYLYLLNPSKLQLGALCIDLSDCFDRISPHPRPLTHHEYLYFTLMSKKISNLLKIYEQMRRNPCKTALYTNAVSLTYETCTLKFMLVALTSCLSFYFVDKLKLLAERI